MLVFANKLINIARKKVFNFSKKWPKKSLTFFKKVLSYFPEKAAGFNWIVGEKSLEISIHGVSSYYMDFKKGKTMIFKIFLKILNNTSFDDQQLWKKKC